MVIEAESKPGIRSPSSSPKWALHERYFVVSNQLRGVRGHSEDNAVDQWRAGAPKMLLWY